MKKSTLIFTLGLFISFIGLMSCGGGGDDGADQARLDSLRQDSIMQAEAAAAAALADSLSQDSTMKAFQDSVSAAANAAISAAGRKGGNKTTTPVVNKIENVKINTATATPNVNTGGKINVKGDKGSGKIDVKGGTSTGGKKGGKINIKKPG